MPFWCGLAFLEMITMYFEQRHRHNDDDHDDHGAFNNDTGPGKLLFFTVAEG